MTKAYDIANNTGSITYDSLTYPLKVVTKAYVKGYIRGIITYVIKYITGSITYDDAYAIAGWPNTLNFNLCRGR